MLFVKIYTTPAAMAVDVRCAGTDRLNTALHSSCVCVHLTLRKLFAPQNLLLLLSWRLEFINEQILFPVANCKVGLLPALNAFSL
jgi:hypothetical protein